MLQNLLQTVWGIMMQIVARSWIFVFWSSRCKTGNLILTEYNQEQGAEDDYRVEVEARKRDEVHVQDQICSGFVHLVPQVEVGTLSHLVSCVTSTSFPSTILMRRPCLQYFHGLSTGISLYGNFIILSNPQGDFIKIDTDWWHMIVLLFQ